MNFAQYQYTTCDTLTILLYRILYFTTHFTSYCHYD